MKVRLYTPFLCLSLFLPSTLYAQTFSFSVKKKPTSETVSVKVNTGEVYEEKKKHVVIFEESREARSPSSFEFKHTDYHEDEGAYRYNLTSK